ncbi:MAG: site-2 protease family protein [Nanopusillaceae archaeon]
MSYQPYISFSSIFVLFILFLSLNLLFLFIKFYLKQNVDYKVAYGILRTQKGIWIIEKLSKSRFVKIFSILSFVFSFILIFASLFLLFYGISTKTPTYALAIPGISYGPITLPIFETIIAIFIGAFIHEIAHGILVYKNNLKLKSWGFFYFGPLIGAFVEPDEKEIENLNWKEKIKIFSAGSTMNIIAGFIAFLLFVLFSHIVYSYNLGNPYVEIVGTIPNTSAYNVIPNNTILYSINGYPIHFTYQISEAISNYSIGENITLYTSSGVYTIPISNYSGGKLIGILVTQNYENEIIPFISSLLFWIFVVNIGLGIANMLPIYPLDGGRTVDGILQRFLNKKRRMSILTIISILITLLIFYNIAMSFGF